MVELLRRGLLLSRIRLFLSVPYDVRMEQVLGGFGGGHAAGVL